MRCAVVKPTSPQRVTYPLRPLETARALPSVLTVSLHLTHEIHACVCTCTWLLHSLSHSAGGLADCLLPGRRAPHCFWRVLSLPSGGAVLGEQQERPWA